MKEHQWINSRGKRLSAIIHTGKTGRNSPVLICCHGFTGDKIGANQLMVKLADAVEEAGFAAVRFDFAGSGESEGKFRRDTTVSGWRTDLASVLSWIKDQPVFRQSPVVLLGHSLGGLIVLSHQDQAGVVAGRIALAPVIYAIDNFRGIILGPELWEKAVTGQRIANFYNKGFSLESNFVADLLENRYNPLATARTYTTPLLIIHGRKDAAVPLHGSEALYDAYGGPKEICLMEDTDHVFTARHEQLHVNVVQWLNRQNW